MNELLLHDWTPNKITDAITADPQINNLSVVIGPASNVEVEMVR